MMQTNILDLLPKNKIKGRMTKRMKDTSIRHLTRWAKYWYYGSTRNKIIIYNLNIYEMLSAYKSKTKKTNME